MLLRASSQSSGADVDLSSVNGAAAGDGGVTHGARLTRFVEAVMGDDEALRAEARSALREVLTPGQFVDACAVIAAFNVVDRIADATGIPLDDMLAAVTADLRADLDLGRFSSAANTPGS